MRCARGIRRGAWRLPVLALLLGLAGCANVSTGTFRDPSPISRLRRGESTKADVLAALGVPNGAGAALFPMAPSVRQEIWYYEDQEAAASVGLGSEMKMQLRMQQIFVFFKGDRFDGYFWTTGSSRPAQ